MPFSPRLTNRPISLHVPNPPTRVAVGRCRAMARIFPKDYVHGRTMLSHGGFCNGKACEHCFLQHTATSATEAAGSLHSCTHVEHEKKTFFS
jgi:hypothetical protein